MPLSREENSALAGSFQLTSHNLAAARASLPGHKKVLQAIEARDEQGARDAMLALLGISASDARRGLKRKKKARGS